MTVLVSSGVASIPGTESGAQANYWVVNDAQVTLAIAAAHASLTRIDLVVINVRDSVYSGANNDSQLQIITGTPGSPGVAPTAPVNSITIAQVAVGASVSSIVNANITDTRYYLAATGGVISCRNDAAAPIGGVEVSVGQLLWVIDTAILYVWNGSAYNQIWPNNWTTWVPTLTNLTLGSGSLTARFRQVHKTLDYKFRFIYGSGSAVGTAPRFTLPFTPHAQYTASNDVIGQATLLDSGTQNRQGVAMVVSGSTVEIFDVNSSGSHATITASSPWTWTTNDSLSVSGTIELA